MKRTYIMTTSRITPGEELKRRNGLGGSARDLRLITARYQHPAPHATLVIGPVAAVIVLDRHLLERKLARLRSLRTV